MGARTLRRDCADEVVVALCKDYGRRATAIKEGKLSRRTLCELRYYNYTIFNAASEIVGERDAMEFISDIGGAVGYAASRLEYFSEAYYKRKKIEVKRCIAKRLHLID